MKKLMANGRWQMENILYYLLILFLPTQLGKHFWPDFAYVRGLRIDYLSPTVYFTDVIVGLLFIVWLFNKFGEKTAKKSKSKIQNHKHLSLWLLVISYLLLVSLFSSRIMGGLYSLSKFLEMSFVAYYTAKFVSDKLRLNKVIILLCISSIFESVLAVLQFLNHGSLGGILYFIGERTFNSSTPGIANASINGELILRPYATFPHPNVLAGYLVVVMTLVLFSLRQRDNKPLTLQIMSLVLGAAALFLTLSRVAIFLWVLILFYYLFTRAKKEIALFIFVLVGFSIFLTPLGARFLTTGIKDEAVSQRNSLSLSAVKMIEMRPLFGVGLSNFIPVLAESQTSLSVATYLQPVHDIYLLVASETGLIGLGFFTWLLYLTYQRIRNQKAGREPLAIIFIIVLITGLFDHYWLTLQQGELLFATVIGLFWAKLEISKR